MVSFSVEALHVDYDVYSGGKGVEGEEGVITTHSRETV